jgi:DNA repair photolyase
MGIEYREEPCRTALNKVSGMPFRWSLNPYMGCAHRCTFCYVRTFEERAGRPGDDRYGRSIRVKVNVAEVLERELGRRSWQRETVAFGSATDPYQPAEGRYRLTRACMEVLLAHDTPFSLITRSPLVLRDLDVLTAASAAGLSVSVTFSVPTLDRKIWRATEPGTPPPHRRMRAVRALTDAGITAGVGIAPILPGISDDPALLRDVVLAARDAGAAHLWWNVLNLRPGTREHFMEALARDWPEQLGRYEELYAGRSYLPYAETRQIDASLKALKEEWATVGRRPSFEVTARPGGSRKVALDVAS